MAIQQQFELIRREIEQTLSQVDDQAIAQFEQVVSDAEAVFLTGKGRSGFVANGFAMRLNQLGKKAHVVGESTTPSIQKGDVLVVISGSGSTTHLKLLADKAHEVGATIVLVTTAADSKIGELANVTLILPAGTKYQAEGSEQPLGSLFEQSAQLMLDGVVLDFMTAWNVDETTMQNNHANLE
ncbi:6-phospho-3-hexuloisomerase [Staphylococcus delphini]|uniref:6-phospho-3-hexuloisomerase n=1 Tax=Staphylococcus delphini TaxID=53344 RepID=UPI0023B304CB|nr:6-phospho-3-hexuloisomerase [Staphylococcus delphini]MDE9798994.1 6-phospho-3-hexuloisomerase [Staphylococcus delphini]MDE9806482.1 6-phospho-3-hexuloisomerase [Staphylococcus delphini]